MEQLRRASVIERLHASLDRLGKGKDKCRHLIPKVEPKTQKPVTFNLPLHCIHEGNTLEYCSTCSGGSKHVRECGIHGKCTRVHVSDRVKSCDMCSDRTYDFSEWKFKSKGRSIELAPEFKKYTDYVSKDFKPYEGTLRRGIIISGGGKYFPSVYITVRSIRHYSQLPIEVWYYGSEGEYSSIYEDILKPYGVTFHDVNTYVARKHWKYSIKSYACLKSEFSEILHLDADSYPVCDFEYLFDSGSTFFPDIPVADKWYKSEHFGVSPDTFNAWETGQYVINKVQDYDVLQLAAFYDQHSDLTWYYGWGDTGTWRAAWSYYNKSPKFYANRPQWVGPAYLQLGENNTPVFLHRCRDKFRINNSNFYTRQTLSENSKYPNLPNEDLTFQWLEELKTLL